MFQAELSLVVNLLDVFLLWLSKFLTKPFVTIPVAPVITGTITRFMLHSRISVHKLLYFHLLSACFGMTPLSTVIATFISMQVFPFLFLIIIPDLFATTSQSVYDFVTLPTSSCSHTGLDACVCVCVYNFPVVSTSCALHTECAPTLSCLIKHSFSPEWGILRLCGQ
jgi:hypothetical protein